MPSKKAVKEPVPMPEPPVGKAADAAQEPLQIPADVRAVLVLGINAEGNLFNHLSGNRLGLIEFAGLLEYGKRILDSLWARSQQQQ